MRVEVIVVNVERVPVVELAVPDVADVALVPPVTDVPVSLVADVAPPVVGTKVVGFSLVGSTLVDPLRPPRHPDNTRMAVIDRTNKQRFFIT